MVRIPAGPFTRGSPPGEGLPEEQPSRRIHLSAFEIDAVPVTWADYRSFIEGSGYLRRELWSEEGWTFIADASLTAPRFWGDPSWEHVTQADQPVCGVSFWEAQAYAAFVDKRLPTEAEWEKAARGIDGRRYPWGNEWQAGRSSVRGAGGRAAPAVGSFPSGASVFGVLDMAGGVWEWCADWYSPTYYPLAPDEDPKGPSAPTGLKVARGGAWNAMPLQLRCANRNAWRPSARFSNLGFRCAR